MKRKRVVNCGRYPKYTYSAAKGYANDAWRSLDKFMECMQNNPDIHGCLSEKEIEEIDDARGLLIDFVLLGGSN